MNKATGLFIFTIGAAVGSVVTWQYTKKIYEQRNQEEIDSVKKTLPKRTPDMTWIPYPPNSVRTDPAPEKEKETARVDRFEEKPNISQYAKILKEKRYTTNDGSPTAESKPYVISPDEFGDFDEYERISLTYYADQVLADDNDERIIDVDKVVGAESLTHFGEYEDDSVFVRNDMLRCDYEILMDTRTYSEIVKERPHQREV